MSEDSTDTSSTVKGHEPPEQNAVALTQQQSSHLAEQVRPILTSSSAADVLNQRIKTVLVLMIVLGYVLVAFTGFWVGKRHVLHETSSLQDAVGEEQENALTYANMNSDLRRKQANLFQNLRVDRATIELLRQENIRLQQNLSDLKEEMAFYKRVVSPAGNAKGLAFGHLSLKSTADLMRYTLAVTVLQITGKSRVAGQLTVSLTGLVGDKYKTLPMSKFVENAPSKGFPLGFHNHQMVQMEISLPEGFEPTDIKIKARFTKGKSVTLKKKVAWEL